MEVDFRIRCGIPRTRCRGRWSYPRRIKLYRYAKFGNTITIPKLVSRIVVWVNGTQLGPGWMDVLATSRDVQPDYLQGPLPMIPQQVL